MGCNQEGFSGSKRLMLHLRVASVIPPPIATRPTNDAPVLHFFITSSPVNICLNPSHMHMQLARDFTSDLILEFHL